MQTRSRPKSYTEKDIKTITQTKSPDSAIFRLTNESLLAYKYQHPQKKIKIPSRPRTATQAKKIEMEFYEDSHDKS